MNDRFYRPFVLIGVLLLTMSSPSFAETAEHPRAVAEVRPAPAAIVLADGLSVGKLVYGGGRTRIVQICAVVMSIALFIMMRRLQ
jgi:hypothetical protein